MVQGLWEHRYVAICLISGAFARLAHPPKENGRCTSVQILYEEGEKPTATATATATTTTTTSVAVFRKNYTPCSTPRDAIRLSERFLGERFSSEPAGETWHPWDKQYIYLHEWLIFMVNVGKYTYNYPTDLMGCITNPKNAVLLGNSLKMIQNDHTFALVDPAKKIRKVI